MKIYENVKNNKDKTKSLTVYEHDITMKNDHEIPPSQKVVRNTNLLSVFQTACVFFEENYQVCDIVALYTF